MGAGLFSFIFPSRNAGKDVALAVLRRVPIFQDLSRREFQKIDGILRRRSLSSGEVIVREGEMSAGMYVVVSGEIEIIQKDGEGKSRRLAILGPGDVFGEQSLLDEEVSSTASAIASRPCLAIGFCRPDLLELLKQDPQIGLKIVRRLSQMILNRWRHTSRLLKDGRIRQQEIEGT